MELGCLWFDSEWFQLFRLPIDIQLLDLFIQMPAVSFHKAKHIVELFLSYLLKYGFIPLLKLFVQFFVDVINCFALLSEPEIDFFLVIRLLVAFDNAFFYELLR